MTTTEKILVSQITQLRADVLTLKTMFGTFIQMQGLIKDNDALTKQVNDLDALFRKTVSDQIERQIGALAVAPLPDDVPDQT